MCVQHDLTAPKTSLADRPIVPIVLVVVMLTTGLGAAYFVAML